VLVLLRREGKVQLGGEKTELFMSESELRKEKTH